MVGKFWRCVLSLAVALAVAFAPSVAADEDADAIVGVWLTKDGEGHVEIVRVGELFEGTIVGGADETPRFDDKNPDPELRSRRLLGVTILTGLTYDGGEKWKDGRIYDPNTGKTYKCKLELDDDGTLKVRGYVGVSWFGRTERWTRQTAPNP